MHRSTEYLEQLVAPIALYPDPLIAAMLPASAYPLEIVEAARFVKDTNNLARIDAQPWDANVKAVARVPEVIAQMDNDIAWTSDLGEAFIDQPKDLLDAIQTLRTQAQSSGALESTAQQDVSDTNGVIEIQPAEPQEIYVPEYNPSDVYGDDSSDYADYYPEDYYSDYWPGFWPYPYVSFGVGVIFTGNNRCDFRHGDVVVRSMERRTSNAENRNVDRVAEHRWQPDPNRLEAFGSASSSERVRQARGVVAGNVQRPTAGTTRVQGTGAGPQIGNQRLSPTSRPQSAAVVREGPAVVREGPAIVREGQQIIYRADDTSPRGDYNSSRGNEPAMHQDSISQVRNYSPSPRGNYYNYQSARPTPMYGDSASPSHEYSASPMPMHQYGDSAPPVHEYSAPMHGYSAPSEGHVESGGGGREGGFGGGPVGGGFGGGGHLGGFGGGGGGHGR